MKIKDDELKSLRIDLKKVIKARPLYFALMASGSKLDESKLSRTDASNRRPLDRIKSY